MATESTHRAKLFDHRAWHWSLEADRQHDSDKHIHQVDLDPNVSHQIDRGKSFPRWATVVLS